jgi:hypothetical protein
MYRETEELPVAVIAIDHHFVIPFLYIDIPGIPLNCLTIQK